jgi:hypothetical protein
MQILSRPIVQQNHQVKPACQLSSKMQWHHHCQTAVWQEHQCSQGQDSILEQITHCRMNQWSYPTCPRVIPTYCIRSGHHVCQQDPIPDHHLLGLTFWHSWDSTEPVSMATALDNILCTYWCCGFQVAECNADPEFVLQHMFNGTSMNLCAQVEHIPEIKWYIQTVKDCTHSGYNSMPFKQIPWLMLVQLVANAVFWLNAFPHGDGVSNTLSPR